MHFKRDKSVEKEGEDDDDDVTFVKAEACRCHPYIASQLSDREPEELRVTKILIGIFFNPNYEIRK